jgi:predicted MFS family arabinose efflux permease
MSGSLNNQVEVLSPPSAMIDARRRRGLLFIALAVAAVSFGMAIMTGINHNFLVKVLNVNPEAFGVLESLRESCGIIAFGILLLLAGAAEPLVGLFMLLLMAAGLSAYAYVPSYWWVVAMSMVWSQGLHVWMPLPNSMTLGLAEPGNAGKRLGQIAAAGALGSMLGLGAALAMTELGVAIRPLWLVAGAGVLLGAAACLGIPRQIKTPGPKILFRRRYKLYYLMSFLEGWRKQIFLSFAQYMLVRVYQQPVEKMVMLWMIAQPIGFFVAPRVGKLIDRVGERRVLMIYYVVLIPLFLCYALVANIYVLYAMFIADSVLFSLAMAQTTYVNRIAPKAEHTQTLSAGVAMNHLAACTMPLLGGFMWANFSAKWPFIMGAAVSAISIFVASKVPAHPPQTAVQCQ